jgi:hypothetical protein
MDHRTEKRSGEPRFILKRHFRDKPVEEVTPTLAKRIQFAMRINAVERSCIFAKTIRTFSFVVRKLSGPDVLPAGQLGIHHAKGKKPSQTPLVELRGSAALPGEWLHLAADRR